MRKKWSDSRPNISISSTSLSSVAKGCQEIRQLAFFMDLCALDASFLQPTKGFPWVYCLQGFCINFGCHTQDQRHIKLRNREVKVISRMLRCAAERFASIFDLSKPESHILATQSRNKFEAQIKRQFISKLLKEHFSYYFSTYLCTPTLRDARSRLEGLCEKQAFNNFQWRNAFEARKVCTGRSSRGGKRDY